MYVPHPPEEGGVARVRNVYQMRRGFGEVGHSPSVGFKIEAGRPPRISPGPFSSQPLAEGLAGVLAPERPTH